MNKLFCVLGLLFSSSTFAGLIGSIEHNYGASNYIPESMASNSCDSKASAHISIKDSSGCQRFVDLFNFADFNFESVDYFTLDLTFSATRDDSCILILFCNYESWQVRPGVSTISAPSSGLQDLKRSNGITQQSFIFNADNLSIFDEIVDNKKFYLWFAENSSGSDQFNLYNASFNVYGTAAAQAPAQVPVPASIALFALGLLVLRKIKK